MQISYQIKCDQTFEYLKGQHLIFMMHITQKYQMSEIYLLRNRKVVSKVMAAITLDSSGMIVQ